MLGGAAHDARQHSQRKFMVQTPALVIQVAERAASSLHFCQPRQRRGEQIGGASACTDDLHVQPRGAASAGRIRQPADRCRDLRALRFTLQSDGMSFPRGSGRGTAKGYGSDAQGQLRRGPPGRHAASLHSRTDFDDNGYDTLLRQRRGVDLRRMLARCRSRRLIRRPRQSSQPRQFARARDLMGQQDALDSSLEHRFGFVQGPQVTPHAPAATASRASSGAFCPFMCGRQASWWVSTMYSVMRRRFRRYASRSRHSAGVSSSSTGTPIALPFALIATA